MQINGLDAMRWLGARPDRPASDVEQILQLKLNNRVVTETNKARRAQS